MIRLLEERCPGLRQQIASNGHGYRPSIATMVRALFTGRRLSQTLPGLANFYMVGQWAGVPGVPMVAAMGRDVVRAICRGDGRAFRTAPAEAREPRPAAADREAAVQSG